MKANSKTSSQDSRARAEATFKKKERQAIEGAKAMAEYEAQAFAVRERMARLRALRLAKEAEDARLGNHGSAVAAEGAPRR